MLTRGIHALYDAIARRAGLVLSLPTSDGLVHHKSFFLGENEPGVWIESAGDDQLAESLIASRQLAGVSFRGGEVRYMFASPVLARQPHYPLGAGQTASAILLQFPSDVRAVQRRSSYRVSVSSDSELVLHCWRIGRRSDLRDRPMNTQALTVDVRDVSLGGLGVVFRGEKGQPPKVTPEDRLRIQLSYGGYEVLVEGRMRTGTPLAGGGLLTGIRFVFLQQGLQGRQTLGQLTRIVGALQREEARHLRAQRDGAEPSRAA